MPRLCLPSLAAPHGVGSLLAACCGLALGVGCVGARAQSTFSQTPTTFAPYTGTFTPDAAAYAPAQTPASNLRRSRTSNRAAPRRAAGPARTVQPLAPPLSGAGTTGFNSNNAPVLRGTTTTPDLALDQPAPPPGGAEAQSVSPYDQPIPPLAGASVPLAQALSPYQTPIPPLGAGAPGQPPVPEIGPIRRKPGKRNAYPDASIDPYAPVGIGVGSFDVYPAVELLGGYSSNPNQTAGGRGAWLYTIAPELLAHSNWSRHSLNAELRGSYTGYSPDSTPTLSRPYLNGRVDGRIDATRDTHIDLDARVLVSTDNPGSPNLQAGLAKLPIYTTFGGGAGITKGFNRFELTLKGDAQRTAYQDSELTDGTTASNKDRNYDQFGGTLRGGYEFIPGVKPFAEIGADTRVHDVEPDAFGYRRDSDGVTGRVGTSVALTGTLTGEASIGYTHRNYEDARFGSLDALIGDASLVWTADALNTLKFSASSSVGESAVAGVSGVLYRDVGLQYDHSFRRWLIGSVKLGFGVDTYMGGSGIANTAVICDCVVTTPGETTPDRQDLRYTAGFGLTYKLSRELWLTGEFRQAWVRSNVTGVDYDESLFLLGARVQR